jgi:hypothetical protein
MRRTLFVSAIFLLFGLSVLTAFAQDPAAVKPSAISGEVGSIDGAKIVLKTANGEIEAVLSDKTQYFRVPPENPTLKAAVAATVSDIGVGDKLLVTGILAADKKSIPAKAVYLMSKSAIAERVSKDKEDWRTRGVIGKVVSYDLATKVITISTRSFAGEKTVVVKPKENAEYYRYAPDSIEFSKAAKSKLSDIEQNDEIRVLGVKNADGSEIQAEKIVTGGFRTNGGTIKAINIEKNEIIISDFQSKKDVSIVVSDYSILKQFPAEMAQRMAMMQAGGGGQGGFRPNAPGGGQTTTQPTPQQNPQTPGQTPGGGGQGGMRGGGGIDDSRFQNIKISDLKVGEMIGVLSSKNPDPNRITAIKLFSGVEPFIKMSQAAAAGGGNRQGGGASLNIPGLDGFGGN